MYSLWLKIKEWFAALTGKAYRYSPVSIHADRLVDYVRAVQTAPRKEICHDERDARLYKHGRSAFWLHPRRFEYDTPCWMLDEFEDEFEKRLDEIKKALAHEQRIARIVGVNAENRRAILYWQRKLREHEASHENAREFVREATIFQDVKPKGSIAELCAKIEQVEQRISTFGLSRAKELQLRSLQRRLAKMEKLDAPLHLNGTK